MTRIVKKSPLTILLVEDDPLIRDLCRELLEHLGYRVETAGDGTEALNKYKRLEQVDLVVLDYYLPDKNGRQVLKDFKALDARARVLAAADAYLASDL